MTKRVFISADHGLAIVYFLQSEVVSTLIKAGVEVVLLTDDGLKEKISERFGQPGLIVEGLRFDEARVYQDSYRPSAQWWVAFLRRVGSSGKINTEAMDSHIHQVQDEAEGLRIPLFPLMRGVVALMRRWRWLRQAVVKYQNKFTPNIYADLFDKYQPGLVLASTTGWRLDRYLLREAAAKGITTAAAIVGWDNPSSYGLWGAEMDWVTCWSELQRAELVDGDDWDAEQVMIGGIPSYDGYFRPRWLLGRDEYFKLHGLDPNRKLISYASSFITFSPNIQNVEALARLVSTDQLSEPGQLLVRLHPNHFMDVGRFADERERIFRLAAELPHVHVVEPVALGGELGHYSGEDMPEKASMMAYSDVFVTVYSTMVVEAATMGRPVVSACIDSVQGWPNHFTLPLSEIGGWPTHMRFREAEAGRVALDENSLSEQINYYLENPDADMEQRKAFIRDECTFVDGTAGEQTAKNILAMLAKGKFRAAQERENG
jgi:hypothetical protein